MGTASKLPSSRGRASTSAMLLRAILRFRYAVRSMKTALISRSVSRGWLRSARIARITPVGMTARSYV